MRATDPQAQAVRQQRGTTVEIPVVWIDAFEFGTGDPASIGFWGGEDDDTFNVVDMITGVSETHTFHGAGALLNVDVVRSEIGFNIRPTTLQLSPIDDAVQLAVRGYNTRGATAQVWRRCYDPDSRGVVGIEPWFIGTVNKAPIQRPAIDLGGGPAEGAVGIEVVSAARLLTIGSSLKKSDAAQRRRLGDRFRRYKGVVGDVIVPWGVEE